MSTEEIITQVPSIMMLICHCHSFYPPRPYISIVGSIFKWHLLQRRLRDSLARLEISRLHVAVSKDGRVRYERDSKGTRMSNMFFITNIEAVSLPSQHTIPAKKCYDLNDTIQCQPHTHAL